MTVSSSTNKASYSGNGSLTTFAYNFKVFDQDDLTVILRDSNGTETVQTITTHYTVTGVGNVSGGNVVFGTAPASGVTVVILREMDLEQGLDLVPNDPFPAQSLENSLDKLTFMVQQHNEELGRAIKASKTNVITGSEFTISASNRANKVFAFDSSGDVSITQELGTFRGDWAASTAYVERDLVKDTTTNNVFIVNSAHTSSGSLPLTTNTNSAKYEKIIDITNPAGDLTVGGNISTSGSVTAGSFVIGSADINENDLEAIDSIVAGTVAASKAVVVDVNKDISSFRNLTATGDITFGGLSDGTITVTDILDEDNMASNSATALSTQQSIKAYVDSQVGTVDTLAEILANGNTTGGTNLSVSTGDDIKFADGSKAIFGAGDDLRINHTGSYSHISDLGTGPLFIGGNDEVSIMNGELSEYKIKAETNGAVTLYYDNSAKLATTSTGVDVTGNVTMATGGSIVAGGVNDLILNAGESGTPDIYLQSGSSTKVKIEGSNGNVGIGTSSPSHLIDGRLSGTSSGEVISVGNVTTGSFGGIAISDGGTYPVRHWGSSLEFYTGNSTYSSATEAMRIDSSGNVGIGVSNPSSYQTNANDLVVGNLIDAGTGLTIVSGTASLGSIHFADSPTGDDSYRGFIQYGHSSNYMRFATNATEAMRIDSSGNVGIGTSSPSAFTGYTNVTIKGGSNGSNLDFHNSSNARIGAIVSNPGTELIIETNEATPLEFKTNSTERMRIDASGNVGIGVVPTTDHNPVVEALQIGSTANLYGRNDAEITALTSNSYLSLAGFPKYITTNEASEYTQSSGNHIWYNAPSGTAGASCTQTERMRLDASGNLLVGTSNAGQPNANAMAYTSDMLRLSHVNGNLANYVYFIYNGLGVGSIANNGGSAVSYNTSSDYRLKTDAQPMTGASARVQALNPVNFEWISDGTRVDGFLAHEAQAIVPEAVTGTKDAMRDEEYEVTPAVLDDDGNVVTEAVMGTRSVPDYQGIDQSKIVPLLTAALREALTKIDALETRITALEG